MDESTEIPEAPGDLARIVQGVALGGCVIVLMLLSYLVGESRGRDQAESAAQPAVTVAAPAEDPALVKFRETCGGCHALASAGTSGAVGPDLDQMKPTRETVLAAISGGGTGSGVMPPGILKGAEAEAVADYVSGSAAP